MIYCKTQNRLTRTLSIQTEYNKITIKDLSVLALQTLLDWSMTSFTKKDLIFAGRAKIGDEEDEECFARQTLIPSVVFSAPRRSGWALSSSMRAAREASLSSKKSLLFQKFGWLKTPQFHA